MPYQLSIRLNSCLRPSALLLTMVSACFATLGKRLRAEEAKPGTGVESSFAAVASEPNLPRSDVGIPIVSFILPGFDQWWEGQYGSAAVYTGAAATGLVYASTIATANEPSGSEEESRGLNNKDDAARKALLGQLVAQGAGGMSAYHAFRTAARTRKGNGQYEFLTFEESPGDIMLAPLRFSYLSRTTTIVPLAIGAALAALTLGAEPPDEVERVAFTPADGFFSAAYSYNAGTHEEAVFRGWIMPVMAEYWGSPFWSNVAQAALFGASHLNTVAFPLPQVLLGYHLGNVTQDDHWRIGEAVFIHAWWNVIAFATQYHFQQKHKDESTAAVAPILWLPPLQWRF